MAGTLFGDIHTGCADWRHLEATWALPMEGSEAGSLRGRGNFMCRQEMARSGVDVANVGRRGRGLPERYTTWVCRQVTAGGDVGVVYGGRHGRCPSREMQHLGAPIRHSQRHPGPYRCEEVWKGPLPKMPAVDGLRPRERCRWREAWQEFSREVQQFCSPVRDVRRRRKICQ